MRLFYKTIDFPSKNLYNVNTMNFERMFKLSFWKTYEMAIDFGSSNLRVSVKGKGVVFNEPSVIAINKKTKKVLAIGHKAKNFIGREHADIAVIKPITRGVITDHTAVQVMIHKIIGTYLKGSFLKPIIMVSVPKNLTEMERKAYTSSFTAAGAKRVHLVPSPVSTAIGNGLNVTNPSGRLIVNFGGGICEISVVTMGTVAVHSQIDIGSIDFDQRIVDYVKSTHEVLIGDNTAEKIKTVIGNVYKLENDEFFAVKGKSLVTGLPSVAKISANEITHIFTDDIEKIAEEITDVVMRSPAELVADIQQYGIIISGQGSLLKGFNELIATNTGFKTTISNELLLSSVNGAQKAVEQRNTLIKTGVI